jgi:hypothetical protein
MNHRLLAIAIFALVSPALALDGDPRMHDPSTVVPLDGKFFIRRQRGYRHAAEAL